MWVVQGRSSLRMWNVGIQALHDRHIEGQIEGHCVVYCNLSVI
jgi:hypothetical protein